VMTIPGRGDHLSFPLPKSPHRFEAGDRAIYALAGWHGEIEASENRGRFGLQFCLMKWDNGSKSSWLLMQHLWPEDET